MQKTLEKLSKELNLPSEVIYKTYKAYWKSIHAIIESLPLKEDLEEDDFNKLRTNFNIPNLGKLSCTLQRYKNIKKRKDYAKYKENKTNG